MICAFFDGLCGAQKNSQSVLSVGKKDGINQLDELINLSSLHVAFLVSLCMCTKKEARRYPAFLACDDAAREEEPMLCSAEITNTNLA